MENNTVTEKLILIENRHSTFGFLSV